MPLQVAKIVGCNSHEGRSIIIMTKKEAQMITETKFSVEEQWANAQDDHERQIFWGWLQSIEKDYAKAQKVLARYN